MAQFSNILKNIFIIILILQFAPFIIKNFSKYYSSLFETHTKVGVITMNSTLSSSAHYIKQFKTFFENTDIKAILIKMDCPGGASGSTQAIFYTIKELKKSYAKPVIVLIENVCASGGYYIAVTADVIIAPASALIGSVGVYMPHPQLKEFIEQFKVKYDTIQSGKYKTAGNPLLATTPEQREMLQQLSDDVYLQFVQDVAESRPQLKLAQQNQWAQGRLFTGHKAKEMELIDEIGSQETAERVIRQKAPIEGKIMWIKAPQPSVFSRFLGRDDTSEPDDETSLESFFNCVQGWWVKQNMHHFF
ncbi:MAG: signal peptide peptidase SppA [Candidatus Babeliaceae bacterium]